MLIGFKWDFILKEIVAELKKFASFKFKNKKIKKF